jgi:hypothetical protein
MAAHELAAEFRSRQERAVFSVIEGPSKAGVLGGPAVAASPSLTAGPEQFEWVAQAIERRLTVGRGNPRGG